MKTAVLIAICVELLSALCQSPLAAVTTNEPVSRSGLQVGLSDEVRLFFHFQRLLLRGFGHICLGSYGARCAKWLRQQIVRADYIMAEGSAILDPGCLKIAYIGILPF